MRGREEGRIKKRKKEDVQSKEYGESGRVEERNRHEGLPPADHHNVHEEAQTERHRVYYVQVADVHTDHFEVAAIHVFTFSFLFSRQVLTTLASTTTTTYFYILFYVMNTLLYFTLSYEYCLDLILLYHHICEQKGTKVIMSKVKIKVKQKLIFKQGFCGFPENKFQGFYQVSRIAQARY